MQEVSITTEGIQKNLKNFKPSLPHGRQGIGRLTFFAFAQRARWNTVYDKDGTRYEYYIDMEKDSLNQYDDNGGKEPKVTEKESGTEVIFTQLHQFSKDEIVARIKIEFFWFLELNRSRYYKILIDGEILSKLVKMIEDRQKVIQGLKELVFDKELYAKEVLHIQNTVENHYWIFGEQYNLITVAEPDFTLALKGLILATTGKEEEIDIAHEDKNKEMDIFMIRQDRKGDVTENVVVELKRPTVALGEKELSQVKKYMQVIRSNDRFNRGNVKWTFYFGWK